MPAKLDNALVLFFGVLWALYGAMVVIDVMHAAWDYTDYARVHDVSQRAYVEVNLRTLALLTCGVALCIARLLRPRTGWLRAVFYVGASVFAVFVAVRFARWAAIGFDHP
jgi:hypothetical protein